MHGAECEIVKSVESAVGKRIRSIIQPWSLARLAILQITYDRVRFHKRFCCALRPTFEKLFTGANVRRRARKIGAGRKTVSEIDSRWIESASQRRNNNSKISRIIN